MGEDQSGNRNAVKILALRNDSNFLLTTILWGNVGVNVLLTLLSQSVLTGLGAFVSSTFIITLFGEIAPQAYFSRNAMKVASLLAPVLRFYQLILYPVAKPSAVMLDKWLGKEGIEYYRERNLRELIKKHIEAPEAGDITRLEGLGALNFLSIDDLPVVSEGEKLHPNCIFQLPYESSLPEFPELTSDINDPFLKCLEATNKKWAILVDDSDEPRHVLNIDAFLRRILFSDQPVDPMKYCHLPIVVRSRTERLGWVLSRLKFSRSKPGENIIENDVILLWSEERRVITGSDIFGRLMSGIVGHESIAVDLVN